MTWEEEMDYRRSCPYDAMGDFSVFSSPRDTEDVAGTSGEKDRCPSGQE